MSASGRWRGVVSHMATMSVHTSTTPNVLLKLGKEGKEGVGVVEDIG